MLISNESIRIVVDRGGSSETYTLGASRESPWSRVLGRWPLPDSGAITELDGIFTSGKIHRIALHGCPSWCLLPILWMRTIWFRADAPEIVIHWDHMTSPTDDRAQQAAGKLSCLLADRVHCIDQDEARNVWGIDLTQELELADEPFDLLKNITDLWGIDGESLTTASDWNESVRAVLAHCAASGHRRVGIYGAGTHTRAIGNALMEPNVEIVCLIDDDSRRYGDKLWGFEIVSRETALEQKLDAVVISANSIEDLLWDRAEVFRSNGIQVLGLYNGHSHDQNESELKAQPGKPIAEPLHHAGAQIPSVHEDCTD